MRVQMRTPPPSRLFLPSCSFPLGDLLSLSKLREIRKFKQSISYYSSTLLLSSASLPWRSSSSLKTSHACAWGPCSRDWVRSAKSRLLYGHNGLHARNVVKRFRLSLCTKEKLLQICSHLLHYSCRAGAALLLLQLLPCSEHRWPSSHPGQAAGLPRLLCTLLPHKLD